MIPKVNLPESRIGDWAVERFTVKADDTKLFLFNLRAKHRAISPGEYTRLTYHGKVIMSDTPAEIFDHYEPVRRAKGQILINGLGLGMVTVACLDKPEVDSVTVVELEQAVIDLVAPALLGRYGNRLTVIQADAFTWQPPKGAFYDVVWHDIWPDLCSDNLPDMKKLHRKYGHRCDWQGSWGREEIQYHKRRYGW